MSEDKKNKEKEEKQETATQAKPALDISVNDAMSDKKMMDAVFASVEKNKEGEPSKDKKQKSSTTKGKGKKKKKKKVKRIVSRGKCFIQATYNNTIVTFTDQNGNTLASCSAGEAGFHGPKKSTAYVAGVIVRQATEKVSENGLKEVDVYVKGVGSGRESAIRSLNANGINVLSIKDVTPIPHNGCRPKKPRRV